MSELRAVGHPALEATRIEVVLPAHNEGATIEQSVTRVLAHLDGLPWSWRLTVADSGSTDGTARIAERLGRDDGRLRLVSVAEPGRGRALRAAWTRSDADVLVYMDVDLSTDLNALLPLVAPLVSGHSDLSVGTRLRAQSRVTRGWRRELISRGYNALLGWTLETGFSDAQCGFKAIRRDAAALLVPQVVDEEWFFDTELLVLAQRHGMRIHEVPVDWVDDEHSTVHIVHTARDDVRGIRRLRGNQVPTQTQRPL